MNMITIYGDFNCPYCYLASQRADLIIGLGLAGIDWRAVEHDPRLAVTGTRSDAAQAAWDQELTEVAAVALPGEQAPQAAPPVLSNTRAAVAAYAEAVSDGVQDELRRRLFHAIWVDRRHLSSAYEVRRLITAVMCPPDLVVDPRDSELPRPLDHDPDLTRIMRRSGGTIAPDGGPVSTAGFRRIRQWRQDWLALPGQVIPAVITPDGTVLAGASALACLAALAAGAVAHRPGEPRRAAARAGSSPGLRRSPRTGEPFVEPGPCPARLTAGDTRPGDRDKAHLAPAEPRTAALPAPA
jgi:DSBA-like thioredoxin domain